MDSSQTSPSAEPNGSELLELMESAARIDRCKHIHWPVTVSIRRTLNGEHLQYCIRGRRVSRQDAAAVLNR